MPEPSWAAEVGRYALKYGIEPALMKAVVEAETGGRNIPGDYRNGEPISFGYGQIIPKWHVQAIRQAAQDCGHPDPGSDPGTLGWYLVKHPDVSLAATALVIREYWAESGNDYDAFTRKYVGPAIPAKDLKRRREIYERWLKTK